VDQSRVVPVQPPPHQVSVAGATRIGSAGVGRERGEGCGITAAATHGRAVVPVFQGSGASTGSSS